MPLNQRPHPLPNPFRLAFETAILNAGFKHIKPSSFRNNREDLWYRPGEGRVLYDTAEAFMAARKL